MKMPQVFPKLLQSKPTLSDKEVATGLTVMAWEGAASSAMFSLGSGGFMAAYALALGANNFQIGMLAALPFITQVFQIPAIVVVEQLRQRKAMSILLWFVGQSLWIPMGLVPFLLETPGALAISAVILLLGVRGIFVAFVHVAWSSWMRDLIPQAILGRYYGRRQAMSISAMAIVGLAGSFFIDRWQQAVAPELEVFGYAYLLLAGALLFGMTSAVVMLPAPEPAMPQVRAGGSSVWQTLREPLRDKNFVQLMKFLFLWSLASNLAIPFFAVYMLVRLELSLLSVILLTVLSQVTNVGFARVWGPLADRFGSKTVLSLSASLYLLVIIGWVFTTMPERHTFTVPLLVVLHAFAGVAAAGVTMTVSTLTLKLAPAGGATPYLGTASMAVNVGTGMGPLLGGRFADYFAERSLDFSISWVDPTGRTDLLPLSLTGFDFLFAIAFLMGLASLNGLIALREEGEVPRDAALQELMASTASFNRVVSSVPVLNIVSAFSYGYLRRIPGLDVALGVAAYQVAASAEAAVRAASHGRNMVMDISRRVGAVVAGAMDEVQDAAANGMELISNVVRGAVLGSDDARAMPGVVIGVMRAAEDTPVSRKEALEGVGYGAVQGAMEAGIDPASVVAQAVEGARAAAKELGIPPDAAAAITAQGALEAAEAAGPEMLHAVADAMPEGLRVAAENAMADATEVAEVVDGLEEEPDVTAAHA